MCKISNGFKILFFAIENIFLNSLLNFGLLNFSQFKEVIENWDFLILA